MFYVWLFGHTETISNTFKSFNFIVQVSNGPLVIKFSVKNMKKIDQFILCFEIYFAFRKIQS